MEVAQHELVQAWWWEGAGRIDLLAPRVRSNPVAQLSFATVPQLLHVSAPKSTALFKLTNFSSRAWRLQETGHLRIAKPQNPKNCEITRE